MSISQGGLDPWAVQLRIGTRDARYAMGALVGPAPGRMLSWADGVLPSDTDNGVIVDLRHALGTNQGMAVRYFPGQCVIARPGEGPYVCTLDDTGRVVLDDADPSNPRFDLIVARVYDERFGDPRTEFVIEPVTGPAQPEPVLPELPPASIPLTRVAVDPGTTQLTSSMITDLRRAAHVRGAIGVLLPGDDPTAEGAYTGQTRYRAGHLESFDGDRWRGTPQLWARETTDVVVRSGQTGTVSLTSIGVPDPGWPYRLQVNGSAELGSVNCRADLSIRLDAQDGTLIAMGLGPGNGFAHVVTQTRLTGALTGPHSIFLSGFRVPFTGNGTWGNTALNASLSILRLPA